MKHCGDQKFVVEVLPMEKAKDPSLFVNDGSFMERFKQLQQEKDKEKGKGKTDTELKSSKVASNLSGTSSPKLIINKTSFALKGNESRKPTPAPSGGKLAFSLKQKSKIVAPSVKLGEDEDENEKDAGNPSGDTPSKRQKLDEPVGSVQSLRQFDVGNYLYYECLNFGHHITSCKWFFHNFLISAVLHLMCVHYYI